MFLRRKKAPTQATKCICINSVFGKPNILPHNGAYFGQPVAAVYPSSSPCQCSASGYEYPTEVQAFCGALAITPGFLLPVPTGTEHVQLYLKLPMQTAYSDSMMVDLPILSFWDSFGRVGLGSFFPRRIITNGIHQHEKNRQRYGL